MYTNKPKTSLAKFEEFFSTEYKEPVFEALESYPNQRSVIVDYLDLEMFDPDLADLLIEKPDDVINAAEKAIKNIDPQRRNADIHVRMSNVTNEVEVPYLSSKYIGKFVAVPCVIDEITKKRPRLVIATFECRGCMRLHEVIQTGNNISEPSICPECGGRQFKLMQEESEFVDTQTGIAKAMYKEPKCVNTIPFVMEDDLVNLLSENEKVMLTGTLRVHRNTKTKEFDTYLYVNYHEPIEEPSIENADISVDEYTEVDPTARDSAEYNNWRLEVLKRDNMECQCCGLNKRLHAHHIFGYEENPTLRLNVGNGITLCQFCHDKYHSVYGLKDITPANFIKFMRRFGNG